MQDNLTRWQQADSRHFLHPFTDHKQLGAKGTRIITRAEGVYIWEENGRKILDGMSGLWCVNLGYSQEELAAAGARQLRELPYYNSFFNALTRQPLNLPGNFAHWPPGIQSGVFH